MHPRPIAAMRTRHIVTEWLRGATPIILISHSSTLSVLSDQSSSSKGQCRDSHSLQLDKLDPSRTSLTTLSSHIQGWMIVNPEDYLLRRELRTRQLPASDRVSVQARETMMK
jgi:hypothetical protein